jgi:streptogramin lyase
VWNGRIWAVLGERFVPLDPQTTRPSGDGFVFEPGHFPRTFLVTDPTGIWYGAYPGENGNGSDRLTRLDPATGEIDEFMELEGHGVILDGSLWTLDVDGVVTRTDLLAEDGATSSTDP